MKYKIAFIGSGNVAANLAHAFDRVGHTITQVVSQNVENAKALASKFGAYYGAELSELYKDADILFICVSDESYAEVVAQLPEKLGALVCHTSGPVGMEVLSSYSGSYGVFYPLQSLRKEEIADLIEVPIFIEYGSDKSGKILLDLADSISNKVREVSSAERQKYHLAAVFANNFTNYMYILSEEYLAEEKLDFDNLLPIIQETALRLKKDKPQNWQTGPAKRGDMKVIEKHLSMLKSENSKDVYELLSKSIAALSS